MFKYLEKLPSPAVSQSQACSVPSTSGSSASSDHADLSEVSLRSPSSDSHDEGPAKLPRHTPSPEQDRDTLDVAWRYPRGSNRTLSDMIKYHLLGTRCPSCITQEPANNVSISA